MFDKIEKIVTSLGRAYEVGLQPYQRDNGVFSTAEVTEITLTIGDPSIGASAGHLVKLSDGRCIEVENAVETWYAPVEEPVNV